METRQPGAQYLKTMVETAGPVRTIIALYEKCLVHLESARESFVAGDVAGKAESLRKAMDIVFYLDNVLDASKPEAAQPLRESYQLILVQLSLANSENSQQRLALAEEWLAELLGAWRGMAPGEENPSQAFDKQVLQQKEETQHGKP